MRNFQPWLLERHREVCYAYGKEVERMLSEKIYTLRRRNGLSQEQLAEKLGVSRQAVSKWEGGLSTPELDKLMALSQCFGVSLDELTGNQSAPPPTKTQEGPPPNPRSKPGSRAGVLLCAIGGACLALLGLLSLLLPPWRNKSANPPPSP